MVGGLTKNQRNCLNFLIFYLATSRGISPTYEEISRELGLQSKSSAARLIKGLRDRGYITNRANAARSIELTSKAVRFCDPLRHVTFLTDDEKRQVRSAAQCRGQSVSVYLHEAVMGSVIAELEMAS